MLSRLIVTYMHMHKLVHACMRIIQKPADILVETLSRCSSNNDNNDDGGLGVFKSFLGGRKAPKLLRRAGCFGLQVEDPSSELSISVDVLHARQGRQGTPTFVGSKGL